MVKIVKFGGSSLADAHQFKKVGDIIKSDPDRRFVVPSAPGKRFKDDIKVTDLLYKAYNAESEQEFECTFDTIKDRYQSIIDELNLTVDLTEEFEVIKKNFQDQISEEYAASRGEYLNGILLANYLGFEFVDPATCIFIDEHGNYDDKKTDPVLSKKLSEVENCVIPGFYGSCSEDPTKIRTFSRGGSDVTGSIVAKCGQVKLYENWTDVSGFLVADPRIVENPKPIAIITYKELRELSYMGASVLHESAIFPVRKEGIPINIRNTNAPEDKGTMIVETTCSIPECIITGIAGKKGFVAINIDKDMMNSEIGFGRKVLQVFEDNGISFEHMPSGIDTMTVIVHQDEFVEKEQKVLAELHRAVNPDSIELESNLALIAVVGRGMKNSVGNAANVISALSNAKINVKMIDQGSSELNIIVGVRNRYFEAAIRAIYDVFIPQK